MVRRFPEPSERVANFVLAAIVLVSTLVALAWVFYVPIFEAPDETVHFEYSAALYSAGGLVAPRDANRLTVPHGRPIPYPAYLEDQAAVAVIAQKPDVKAPAGYGSSAYYSSVDSIINTLRQQETAYAIPNTLATAFVNFAQLSSSFSNCFRPTAVNS